MCDDVMKMVMKKLVLPIPEFVLERRIVLFKPEKGIITINGEDSDGSPYEIFKQVTLD